MRELTAATLKTGDYLVFDDGRQDWVTSVLKTELGNVFVWIPGCLPHEPLVFHGTSPVKAVPMGGEV